ncbi:hypothetical protein, partial [Stenotrophomonas muris]
LDGFKKPAFLNVLRMQHGEPMSTQQNQTPRKDPFNARMERALIERLKAEAKRSGISPSEKLRRILDNALPHVA